MFRRIGVAVAALAVGMTVLAPSASADGREFPAEFSLPDGFQPEGIGIGTWPKAYFGSRVDGRIYQVDLSTGTGEVLSPGPGTPSLGIKVDSERHRIFVAGGTGGDGRVIDTRNGKVLASYKFSTGDSFVNDAVITQDAVYFTDSRQAQLYKLALGRDGRLPATFSTIPLSGEWVQVPGAVNANGLVATPDGRGLVVGQSNTGKLFRVDPATGAAKEVDLAGESVPSNDGLLREGRQLYVVQNRLNTLAKLELKADGSAAKVVQRVTDPRFDVPATVAAWGNRFYLVNARFTTPPTPATPYNAVAVGKF
jgi:sugar lactone lactonase YvrE